ncbi:MAG: UDP-2,3-diacylglucosamine diphosphatase [Cytophagaceae bacterium]
MISGINQLPAGKKIYFASDFHLGVPNYEDSLIREKKIISWLSDAQKDAHAIFLLGDIFDFWFEYKHSIPKGFTRLLGKLAELSDSGINLFVFTGNHDMWLFDYFPKELNIPVFRTTMEMEINNFRFLIGHGDGLGPGDHSYKILKKFFNSKICQWLFRFIHPDIGIGIANYWSRSSRINNTKRDETFMGEKEFLYRFCMEQEKSQHRHFYIFGHRHLPLDMKIGDSSRYINLGEWVNHQTYAVFDGKNVDLIKFNSI